jgi:hypothetical protein
LLVLTSPEDNTSFSIDHEHLRESHCRPNVMGGGGK